MHPVFDLAAGWFVEHSFAVAIPMRRGYGSSQGEISDIVGDCDDRDYFTSARMHAPDIEGVIAYMQRQSFVDPNYVVVLGHSWGGLGALGAAYDAPRGVVGILNFAGGGGSFAPGQICGGTDRLIADVGRLGTGNPIPQIWLYAENDHFFAPPLAHAMFEAYRANARAPITFVDLPRSKATAILRLRAATPRSGGRQLANFSLGCRRTEIFVSGRRGREGPHDKPVPLTIEPQLRESAAETST
jgi:pimeloyl-ACP methyl ester carboxylesterase